MTETNFLILQLIHGRNEPDAAMKTWGFDAEPIGGVAFLRGTYLTTLTVGFYSEDAFVQARKQTGWPTFDDLVLEVKLYGDLIQCNDGYYGDFELYALPAQIIADKQIDMY